MPRNKDVLALIPHEDRKLAKATGLLFRLLMTFSGGISNMLEQVHVTPSDYGYTLGIAEHLIGSGDLINRRIASANRSLPYKIKLL